MWKLRLVAMVSVILGVASVRAGDADEKYPLDAQLKVLAADVKNEKYRKLVLEKMLSTDLAAECTRVTADNAEASSKSMAVKIRCWRTQL